MTKKISYNERIFIAGSNGMVGKAVLKSLREAGYGLKKNGGTFLTPSRKELDLSNYIEVESWFQKYKPTVVILAAAKVGGIFANDSKPAISNKPISFRLESPTALAAPIASFKNDIKWFHVIQ